MIEDLRSPQSKKDFSPLNHKRMASYKNTAPGGFNNQMYMSEEEKGSVMNGYANDFESLEKENQN